MYVIMGATGHVGGAVARALLEAGQPVTALVHRASHGRALAERGAEIVEADAHDAAALRAAFRRGRRAFLLNPPADVSTDTDAEERATVRGILDALDGSGLDRVVAASTYGAQPGERIGDLSVLYELEQGLAAQPIPAQIQRGAYYMSNWDALLDPVRQSGDLPTMLPADLRMPMVSPQDLGRSAAHLLQSDEPPGEIVFVEGPARYSTTDVAHAFANALRRDVKPTVIPRDQWRTAYRKLGFSEAAADAYVRMTAASIDQDAIPPAAARHGDVTLEAYIADLVSNRPAVPAG